MMLRRKISFRLGFAIVACLAALFPKLHAAGGDSQAGPSPDEQSVRARANALLAQMTPEEKAGQLVMAYCFVSNGTVPPRLGENLAKGGIGAINFVAAPAQTNALQKYVVENSRLKIPLLFGFNVIHGFRTIFPVPIGMAATWDPRLVEQSQAAAAAEARAVGIHWALAPVLDIARDPRWGRIVEGSGEDPWLSSAMAVAHVRGFQGPWLGSPGRIIAGPKHFVGYGAALGGRDYDEVDLSESELWNVYFPPFEAAVKAGAGNVMTAYMGLNGVPATGNSWLITDVLRKSWGYQGFVVSDANAVKDLETHGVARDKRDAAAVALKTGVDMELALGGHANVDLPAALAAGLIESSTLDAAVRRILEMKIRLGLFENPYVDLEHAKEVLANPVHRDLARVTAERSAVLLRNEGGLLPLAVGNLKSLAVIGPLADAPRQTLGPWIFNPDYKETVSILAGIRAKVSPVVQVNYAWGTEIPDRLFPSPFGMLAGESGRPAKAGTPDEEIAHAVEIARGADAVILVLGESQDMIGEAASRSTLDLPGRQNDLLDAVAATGKPVVLVLVSGRPLDLRHATEKAAAILDVWYPGTQGGTAVANLLFGDAVPGGKLPFTWVRHVGQVPMFYAHLTSHVPKSADKRYWNEESTPLFPFGYGLSYSRFDFANLKLDRPTIAIGGTVSVSVDLKNTGPRKADEVAQLYIHQRYGSAARPVRELKGLQRVTLELGETRTLKFELGPDQLRYWSSAKKGWVLEASIFDVWIGSDSDAQLTATFETTGTETRESTP
ncbi:MAG: beta-glucosidase BglX [Opitutaceae bacterium]